MAWLLNFYRCARCTRIWTDEWSCIYDDECPHCGARNMSPLDSKNLTEVVTHEGQEFTTIRSPVSAEHNSDYRELGRFPTRAKAEEFLTSIKPD